MSTDNALTLSLAAVLLTIIALAYALAPADDVKPKQPMEYGDIPVCLYDCPVTRGV